jgi:hypothetical protein
MQLPSPLPNKRSARFSASEAASCRQTPAQKQESEREYCSVRGNVTEHAALSAVALTFFTFSMAAPRSGMLAQVP